MVITPEKWLRVIKDKNEKVVELIMKKWNYSRADALKLWYNSRTKRVTLDSNDLSFISPTACLFELELELSNDPSWMTQDFE